jgi:isoleucyl-tRNA synthetase
MKPTLECVDDKISFPTEEEKILEFWDSHNIFQKQDKQSLDRGDPEYTFYDGPPFASGKPHYGHILTGTIKDIVTRYWAMNGYHVNRRFGWDCHGLPIEYEIDQKLGITSHEDVLKMGIRAYNDECRSIVMRCVDDWKRVVPRCGRWIDMENPYKTMDPTYMESVWNVFQRLYKKDLIYRGYRIMPFSTACRTPLSNFESNQNYKDVVDSAIVVSFTLKENSMFSEKVELLAWTTTPWTLVANLALAVHPGTMYVKFRDNDSGNVFICAKTRINELYPKWKKVKKTSTETTKAPYEIINEFCGSELSGLKYEPLFNYFESIVPNGFQVIIDEFVTDTDGTGIVHCAPVFGEEDFNACITHGIIDKHDLPECPVNDSGCYTNTITDFVGRYIKDCDKDIIRNLKTRGHLIHQSQIKHSYPFCWRSDTPLIYRAVSSYFVAVEKIKDKLIINNKKSQWTPKHIQEKRFDSWLQNTHDWSITRNRFWGTPIPIWICEETDETICIGSIEELEQLSGVRVTDLHRDFVDDITIPSQKKEGCVLRRVPDVFDCWFESGAMPYAHVHYPFEHAEDFKSKFPADFISEGVDQTRGWFYTLLVLSTALFDEVPFKHVIVNGHVLAEDGKKMSKRLKNYPDPTYILDSYGADALRLYLINSPVVRGENIRFKERNIRELIQSLFLPWYNAYKFLIQNIYLYNVNTQTQFTYEKPEHTHRFDIWMNDKINVLINFIHLQMQSYQLDFIVKTLIEFMNEYTNWYVKLSRDRFKGRNTSTNAEWKNGLLSFYSFMMKIIRVMSPFAPFITEMMYQNLKKLLPIDDQAESIHLLSYPIVDDDWKPNSDVQHEIQLMKRTINECRTIRSKFSITGRTPLHNIVLITKDQDTIGQFINIQDYIIQEVNTKHLDYSSDISKWFDLTMKLSSKSSFKKKFKRTYGTLKIDDVNQTLSELDYNIIDLMNEQNLTINVKDIEIKVTLNMLDFDIKIKDRYQMLFIDDNYSVKVTPDFILIVDTAMTTEIKEEHYIREFIFKVQQMRKRAHLVQSDKILIKIETTNLDPINTFELFNSYQTLLNEKLGYPIHPLKSYLEKQIEQMIPHLPIQQIESLISESYTDFAGHEITIHIMKD